MPLPASKEELLNNLREAYKKLDDEFEAVTKKNERHCGIDGNISCCDVVAYQIGWARLLLGWEATELKGNVPAMPAKGYKWNQLGGLAESFYEKDAEKSLRVLRNEFKRIVKRVTGWLESLSEKELFSLHQRDWAGNKWPIAKWVQVNTIAPYRSARTKVRRWKKDNGI
jgi:hypothetical protein